MNSPEQIGVVIKNARTNKHLTQKELAEKLFVEPTAVSRWECGRGYPSPQLMEDICECLEITLFELLGEDSDIEIRKAFRNKKISIAKIVISFLEAAILPFFFIKNKYFGGFYCFDESSFWNLINILTISSITFLVISLVFNVLDTIKSLRNKHVKTFPIVSLASLSVSVIFVAICVFFNKRPIFHSIIGICSTFIFLFLFILYKIVNYKKIRIIICVIDAIVGIVLASLFYNFGLIISLRTQANVLIVFYYMFGIIPNLFPFVYLSIRFKKKIFWFSLIIAPLIFNTVFIAQFYEIAFAYIYEFLVYAGVINSSFGILTIDEILKGALKYDY